MNDAFVVSIEVDGRQAYILETDRLREMLGASRLILRTVREAESLFKDEDGLHMFSPVSGEIRAWALEAKRSLLLQRTWKLREWLDSQGIEHTVGLMPAASRDFLEFAKTSQEDAKARRDDRDRSSLARVHAAIGALVAVLKGRKPGVDARPTCSLFAPCRIHGFDPATTWRAGRQADAQDDRRDLTGARAHCKLAEWERVKKEFVSTDLVDPTADARRAVEALGLEPQRAVQLDHLSEADTSDGGDQFIAFICADGDGMGRVLTSIDWNHPDLRAVDDKPWKVNERFAREFDGIVHKAYAHAVNKLLDSHQEDFEGEAKRSGKAVIRLPLLPQLLGGDDLWTVCRKRYALEFCDLFGACFRSLVQSSEVIRTVVRSANRRIDELTISMGVAFAKAGHPAYAMLQAAESLLREAKKRRKGLGAPQGCVDWHWIDSSLSQPVNEARATGWTIKDDDAIYNLTTRPWTLDEARVFVEASAAFSRGSDAVPRRKREQLDDILRRGALSRLAWDAWLKGLEPWERTTLARVLDLVGVLPGLEGVSLDTPWSSCRTTPWLDLLALDDVLGLDGDAERQTVAP